METIFYNYLLMRKTGRRSFVFLFFILCASVVFSQKNFKKEIDLINDLFNKKKYTEVINQAQDLLKKQDKKLTNFNKSILHANIGLSYENLNNGPGAEEF